MGAMRRSRGITDLPRLTVHVALMIVAGLAAGCGTPHTSSVLHATAPLPADVTVAYAVGGSNPPATPGLTGLRGRDGTDAWHAATGEPANNSLNPPVEVNGVIYTEGGTVPTTLNNPTQVGTVAAVRATDGHILWNVALPTGTGSDDRDFHIATNGVIVLVTDPTAGLYALAATTGTVRWHLDEPATWPIAVGDGLAVATLPDAEANQAHVVAYREDDGTFLWQGDDFPYGVSRGIGTIGINRTAAYTAGQSGLTAYAPRSGAQLWHQETAGNIIGVDDHSLTIGILDGSGSVASFDAATGNTNWRAGGPNSSWTIPMMQTPTALYVSDPGGTHLIALSMTNGAQLWRAAFPGYRFDSLAQQQGVVFADLLGPPETNTLERLVALDGASGTVYWERDLRIYALVSTPV